MSDSIRSFTCLLHNVAAHNILLIATTMLVVFSAFNQSIAAPNDFDFSFGK